MADSMARPTYVPLSDGRHLAVDDVGDPDGRPVVYFHGSPSCRLGRPPLDPQVGEQGVRLLAFDRPGLGHSDPDPSGSASSFADDLALALDHLGVEQFDCLAWSAGAIWALAAAAHPNLGPRVRHLTIVAGLVPAEAFADPALRDACRSSRAGLLDTAVELGPEATAELAAPMLVPYPCTAAEAREHLLEYYQAEDMADIDSVPGGMEQSATALVESVRQGLDGAIRELAAQLTPLDIAFGTVKAPTRLVYGDLDVTCPPAFGHWLADRLPNAQIEIAPGGRHGIAYTRWLDLLR